jgi:hypothetical protein
MFPYKTTVFNTVAAGNLCKYSVEKYRFQVFNLETRTIPIAQAIARANRTITDYLNRFVVIRGHPSNDR